MAIKWKQFRISVSVSHGYLCCEQRYSNIGVSKTSEMVNEAFKNACRVAPHQ